jgi:hypothetical protein
MEIKKEKRKKSKMELEKEEDIVNMRQLWNYRVLRKQVTLRLYHSPKIVIIRSSSTMALMSTQPLTKMSPRNLPGGRGR